MNKKTNHILLYALLLSIATGLWCDYIYKKSPENAINSADFQNKLIGKETQAAKILNDLQQIIVHSSIDSLTHYPFANNDIAYYVFEKEELVFWSDNHLDISNFALPDSTDWHYVQLPNAHCVSRLLTFENKKILALITIKNNYPYENDELINNFASGFEMDKKVQIVNGKNTDKQAVFCSH